MVCDDNFGARSTGVNWNHGCVKGSRWTYGSQGPTRLQKLARASPPETEVPNRNCLIGDLDSQISSFQRSSLLHSHSIGPFFLRNLAYQDE